MSRETVTINDAVIHVLAYMHPTDDACVTAAYDGEGATVYDNPRKLVAWDDVVDQADWLERGIAEWRAYAVETAVQNVALKKQRDELLAAIEIAKPVMDAHAGPSRLASFNATLASVKGGAA